MRIFILFVIFLCIISGCKDWEYPQNFPIVLTEEIKYITPEGAELIGSIESLGSNQNIINYGFVLGLSEMPTLNSSSHIFMSGEIKKGKFSKVVQNDLLDERIYYVRAFIQTETKNIYGNQVAFSSQGSLPPSITDFTPTEGFVGTEITIHGQNFSSRIEGNVVVMGSQFCQVISASDTLLRVLSPRENVVGTQHLIAVVVANKLADSENEYTILGPRITSISSHTGRVGDLVIMEGEYFDMENDMKIYFKQPLINPFEWYPDYSNPYINSENQLECYVASTYPETGKIELHSSSIAGKSKFTFPENFTIINSWAKISNTTPLHDYTGYSSANIGNSVFVIGGKTLYEFNSATKIWSQKADFPGSYRFFGTAYSINGKLYYGFGEGYLEPKSSTNGEYYNDLWVYNPATNLWSLVGSSPMTKRSRLVSMVINDKVYFGFGLIQSPSTESYLDFWEYDTSTNSWVEALSPPISKYSGFASSFAVANKGYVVGLETSGLAWSTRADFWEYDPSVPSWKKKQDYPDLIHGETATTRNNHGLVISSAVNTNASRIYEYDPYLDRWITRQLMTDTSLGFQFAHYINGKLFYSSGNLWELSFD